MAPSWLRSALTYRAGLRLLRQQTEQLTRIADALDRLAPLRVQQATAADQSGVSYVDDREASVLEQVQRDLASVLGREPSPEEVLDAFEGKA